MPLDYSKSKKAFQGNVKKELAAGKSPKQAVAVAHAVQRRAKTPGHGVQHPTHSNHARDKHR